MKLLRVTLVFVATAALITLGLLQLLASDEQRIRDRVAGAVDAFNDRRPLGVVDVLHPDWTDGSSGPQLDRASLRGVLLHAFQSGGFRYRCVVPETSWQIERIDGADGTGHVVFVVEFRAEEGDAVVWSVEVSAEFVRHDDLGWCVRRSTHRTLSGRRPR